MAGKPLQRYLKLRLLVPDSFLQKVVGPIALWLLRDRDLEALAEYAWGRKMTTALKVDAMWRAGVFRRLAREGFVPRQAVKLWDAILFIALNAEKGSKLYNLVESVAKLVKLPYWRVKEEVEALALEYGFEEHYVYLARYYRMGVENGVERAAIQVMGWRRGRDLNPRGVNPHRLSRPAPYQARRPRQPRWVCDKGM